MKNHSEESRKCWCIFVHCFYNASLRLGAHQLGKCPLNNTLVRAILNLVWVMEPSDVTNKFWFAHKSVQTQCAECCIHYRGMRNCSFKSENSSLNYSKMIEWMFCLCLFESSTNANSVLLIYEMRSHFLIQWFLINSISRLIWKWSSERQTSLPYDYSIKPLYFHLPMYFY